MTLVTSSFKRGLEEFRDRVAAMKQTSDYIAKPSASTKLVGPQTSVAVVGGFSVASDEPEWLGGYGTAPSPSTLFCASIGFAEDFIFARQAVLHGVDFDSYETKVEGTWDMRGSFGLEGKDPAVSEFQIETKVSTQAPAEKIVELLKLTHQRCPMTATVSKAAKVNRKLWVNGTEVSLG
jgi:uncharacterized OsmC-like protein